MINQWYFNGGSDAEKDTVLQWGMIYVLYIQLTESCHYLEQNQKLSFGFKDVKFYKIIQYDLNKI